MTVPSPDVSSFYTVSHTLQGEIILSLQNMHYPPPLALSLSLYLSLSLSPSLSLSLSLFLSLYLSIIIDPSVYVAV